MTFDAYKSKMVHWLGVGYSTVLSAEATGEKLSIVYSESPEVSGPPRHIHHREDEAFVILEGVGRFWMAGATFEYGPGDTVFVPRGIEHTFRALTPFRHFVIFTPGGFEHFFDEMASKQFRIPDDMDAVNEAAARHNLSFTGPPLQP
jgi:quercetin dioxygenase-like cupin family protein